MVGGWGGESNREIVSFRSCVRAGEARRSCMGEREAIRSCKLGLSEASCGVAWCCVSKRCRLSRLSRLSRKIRKEASDREKTASDREKTASDSEQPATAKKQLATANKQMTAKKQLATANSQMQQNSRERLRKKKDFDCESFVHPL